MVSSGATAMLPSCQRLGPSVALRRTQPSCGFWALRRRSGSRTQARAAITVLQDEADAATRAATQPGQNSRAGSTALSSKEKAPGFVWTRHWWPLVPESYLSPDRPTPVMLLGIPLVVWRDGAGDWRVFRDLCPHRLAPLSEGRVESDGTLLCSYHGWRFAGSGACTRIPQAVSPEAEGAACRSRRSCAVTFPVQTVAGMLWVWPDDSPDAASAAAATPVEVSQMLRDVEFNHPENVSGKRSGWFMRDLPYSYEVLLENLIDPSHLPYSHHGVSPLLQRSKGVAMPMQPTQASRASAQPTSQQQQEEQHRQGEALGGAAETAAAPAVPPYWTRPTGPDYEFDFVGHLSPDATLSLHLPHHVLYTYRYGPKFTEHTEIFLVPVAPGRSRFFGVNRSRPTARPPPLYTVLLRPQSILPLLLSRLDPVASAHRMLNTILDGDSVFLHVQDKVLQALEEQEAASMAAGPRNEDANGTGTSGTASSAWSNSSSSSSITDGGSEGSSNSNGAGGSVWSRRYYMPAPADSAVLAARRWVDERAGGGPFRSRQQRLLSPSSARDVGAVPGEAPTPEERRTHLLNRYDQHTRHCPNCRSQLELLQRLGAAARAVQTALLAGLVVAAGALGAAVVVGAAAGQGVAATLAFAGWPAALLVLCGALWGAAGWVAREVQRLAQEFVFVDYVHAERD